MITDDEIDRAFAAFVEARESGASVRDAIAEVIAVAKGRVSDDELRRTQAYVILSAAAKLSGVPRRTLVQRDKTMRVSLVRRACMLSMRQLGFSMPQIGRALWRDHSTVLHGLTRAGDHERTLAAEILREAGLEPTSEEVLRAVG